RGDGPYPGRQARGAVDQAGDRDRVVEGSSRRCRFAGPSVGIEGLDEAERRLREPCRPSRSQEDITETVARDAHGPEARGTAGGVSQVACAAGAQRGQTAFTGGAPAVRAEGRPHAAETSSR